MPSIQNLSVCRFALRLLLVGCNCHVNEEHVLSEHQDGRVQPFLVATGKVADGWDLAAAGMGERDPDDRPSVQTNAVADAAGACGRSAMTCSRRNRSGTSGPGTAALKK